jgi:hypothetical protein
MGLRLRDVIGTLLVAAVAVPYVGYLINGEMPFIQDPRGMAATGLILGAAAFLVMRRGDATGRLNRVEVAVAVVAGSLGVIALALAETAAAEVLLAVFMVAVLGMFLVEILDHTGVVRRNRRVPATR